MIKVLWDVILAGLGCPKISEKELSTFVLLLQPLYAQRWRHKMHSHYQEIVTQWKLIKNSTAMQMINLSNCEVCFSVRFLLYIESIGT